MTAHLLLSPSADESLDHLRRQVKVWRQQDQLMSLHLLLSSRPVADWVRTGLGDSINVHYYQIYDLGRSVLQAARMPCFELNDIAIRRLVHHTLQQMEQDGEISSFVPVIDKPGFTDTMVAWLREVKSQGIHPDDVSAHANTCGGERDRQLAALYQRYQRFLQVSNTSDADGQLWLAAEALEGDASLFLHDGPLFIFGFDQYTPIQLRIINQLAGRYSHCTIYLTWDNERNDSSLSLTRLAQTRHDLASSLQPSVQILKASTHRRTEPALEYLRSILFESANKEPYADPGPAIRMVEAPSREEEMRWAIRAVKQLILDGVSCSEVVIAAPKPGIYCRLAATVATEYGVPIKVEQTLDNSPAVSALLNILGLYPDFSWRQTFQALRSPYIRQSYLSPEQLDLLDQLTRERPVVGGKEQWQYALYPLTLKSNDSDDDEDRSAPPLVSQIEAEELTNLAHDLLSFFEQVTPPDANDFRTYAVWFQESILGLFTDNLNPDELDQGGDNPSLDVLRCCADGPYAERDLLAIQHVLSALRQLLTATDLVAAVDNRQTWSEFVSEFAAMLPAIAVQSDSNVEAISFSPLAAIRSLPTDHLLVLGLSEGEFPPPPRPDPLYTPQERQDHPLRLRNIRDGDDACLWWQVLGNCRKRLTLLRPWADDGGAVWPPSPYWNEVRSRFSSLEVCHITTAATLTSDQAASHNELITVLAQASAAEVPQPLGATWRHAHEANALMTLRRSWSAPGVYEGILEADDLLDELQLDFGPAHIWSASRLNRYGNCPFAFFAEQLLKLEARTDPVEGLDAAQRGSILHAILERLYGEMAEHRIFPSPDRFDNVLKLLETACELVFQDAPQRYGFRPSTLWRHEQSELKGLLATLLEWESDANELTQEYEPYRQEVAFGIGRIPPVTVDGIDGTEFYLRGFIDRVDRNLDGVLRIVDYKSGSTSYSKKDVQSGLALQTALYAVAAEELLDGAISQSYYLHIPTRELSGRIYFSGPVAESAEVLAAISGGYWLRCSHTAGCLSQCARQSERRKYGLRKLVSTVIRVPCDTAEHLQRQTHPGERVIRMPSPTEEQLVAIRTHDRSLIVEAGAGTGKTWVLVERFLHLLETNPAWPLDSLIAITFTEKAAREMRDRVRRAIEERHVRDSDPVWTKRRVQLDRLQISTVHSLCARILRENAIAAEVDPGFVVLDEQDSQLLRAEAKRQTIEKLVDSDSPSLELLVWLRTIDLQNEMQALLSKRGTIQSLFETMPDVDRTAGLLEGGTG